MNVKILPAGSVQPVNRQPTNACKGFADCNGKLPTPATPVSGGGGSVCDWEQIANGNTYCKGCPAGTKVHYCEDIFDAGKRCVHAAEYESKVPQHCRQPRVSSANSDGNFADQSGSTADGIADTASSTDQDSKSGLPFWVIILLIILGLVVLALVLAMIHYCRGEKKSSKMLPRTSKTVDKNLSEDSVQMQTYDGIFVKSGADHEAAAPARRGLDVNAESPGNSANKKNFVRRRTNL
jgi:hypothetical protein